MFLNCKYVHVNKNRKSLLSAANDALLTYSHKGGVVSIYSSDRGNYLSFKCRYNKQ